MQAQLIYIVEWLSGIRLARLWTTKALALIAISGRGCPHVAFRFARRLPLEHTLGVSLARRAIQSLRRVYGGSFSWSDELSRLQHVTSLSFKDGLKILNGRFTTQLGTVTSSRREQVKQAGLVRILRLNCFFCGQASDIHLAVQLLHKKQL